MKIVVDHDRTAMAAVLEDWNFKYQQFQMCPPANAGMASAEAEETWRRVKEISTDTLNTIGRLVDHLGAMPGRRDLIIASSGFLGASMEEQKSRIIDRALRAGVVISALDSKGLFIDYGLPDPTRKVENEYKRTEQSGWVMAMNEPMAALAEATGGVYYHNNNDLTAGFREMGSPDYTYRISFRPDGVTPDGSYHKLKVKVVHAKGNYSLQARPGYFAPNEKAETESPQAKIDREILADDMVAGFPLGIAVRKGDGTISVVVSVDISKLRFAKRGDRQMQRIAFTTALIDAQGKIVAAKEGLMDLALTEATYKRLSSTGVNAILTLPASPGAYKLREIAEEALDGKLACSTHAIEIK